MELTERLAAYSLILASQSPRRRQLLDDLGLKFTVKTIDYDESWPEHLMGADIARHVALAKAEQFRGEIAANEIVITADTIVWCDGIVLGKPADEKDAVRILNAISGNTHEVITGVVILSRDKEVCFTECTSVTFARLTDEEILYYIREFSPWDKAGAYGIQEWIGVAACESIHGSYFNVVGLPVHRLYRELLSFVQ
jgi:septum formation protein